MNKIIGSKKEYLFYYIGKYTKKDCKDKHRMFALDVLLSIVLDSKKEYIKRKEINKEKLLEIESKLEDIVLRKR